MGRRKKVEEIKKPNAILALDVSTKAIGLSLLKVDDEWNVIPLEVTHLKLNVPNKYKGKTMGLFLKANMFTDKLMNYKDLHVDTCIIEEPLLASNNQYTVSTLLRFNGIISWMVYKTLGVVPEYISTYDARKYGMPQLMGIRKFNKKGEMYSISKIKSEINKEYEIK